MTIMNENKEFNKIFGDIPDCLFCSVRLFLFTEIKTLKTLLFIEIK